MARKGGSAEASASCTPAPGSPGARSPARARVGHLPGGAHCPAPILRPAAQFTGCSGGAGPRPQPGAEDSAEFLIIQGDPPQRARLLPAPSFDSTLAAARRRPALPHAGAASIWGAGAEPPRAGAWGSHRLRQCVRAPRAARL